MRPLRSQKTPNVSEKEHFVTIEMLQDSGEQYNWHLLHELVCTGRTKWLGAGDQKAPRVTHESQRLLMPGEPSQWANPPRCAHVSGDPLSAEESEDGEMPEEKNQWVCTSRRVISSQRQCYYSTWEPPVQSAYPPRACSPSALHQLSGCLLAKANGTHSSERSLDEKKNIWSEQRFGTC